MLFWLFQVTQVNQVYQGNQVLVSKQLLDLVDFYKKNSLTDVLYVSVM